MATSTSKQKLLFNFLKNNKTFTVGKMVAETGYTKSTVQTYLRKKLMNYWVERKNSDTYAVSHKFNDVRFDKFVEQMCQTSKKCR